jgi:hypothetical protein|nr:MAG TPA: hypothetical protein [Caudoviricetes sp.]
MEKDRKRVCCNCDHNIRSNSSEITCSCELDGHRIGYAECMHGWCRRWKKETKWGRVRNND